MVQKIINSEYAFQKTFTRSFVQYLHFQISDGSNINSTLLQT